MIPKEKARELVDKFLDDKFIGLILEETEAKQCASIAVDEILKAVEGKYDEYWQEVKQEIERL